MSPLFSELDPLADKLKLHSCLSQADRAALLALPVQIRLVSARTALFRGADPSCFCFVLLNGYAAQSKLLRDGSRQFVDLMIRGDLIGVERALFRRADYDVEMLTGGRVAMIASSDLEALIAAHAGILRALWSETILRGAIQREWTANVGRRDAPSRLAHLLCEMVTRHEQQGLGGRASFELQLTQSDLADCTGLTPVHVNRVLRGLTDDGLIGRERGRVTMQDWQGLVRLAGFDDRYLQTGGASPAPVGAEMPL